MTVEIDLTNGNFIPAQATRTPAHGRYTWRKLRGWTGSPDYVRYFDRKPGAGPEGRDLDEMLSFQVAVENPNSLETDWHSVSAFGVDATSLKKHLMDDPKVLFLFAEGVVRQSPDGLYENISGRNFKILGMKQQGVAPSEAEAAYEANIAQSIEQASTPAQDESAPF